MQIKSIILAEVVNPNTGEVSKKVKALLQDNSEMNYAESPEDFKKLTKGKDKAGVLEMTVLRNGQYGAYLSLRKYKVEETLF